MTSEPSERELERRVDRALKQLPTPAAPATLLARVMTGVRAHASIPAPVPEWPLPLRIALLAVSAGMIAGALLVWPFALEWARATWQSPDMAVLRAAFGAARPILPIVLLYVAAMCAACAAAASVLKHVALGGASQS